MTADEMCGAPAIGGPCRLPVGHNMGHLDVPENHDAWVDPVSVSACWVANCDDCGWHCPATEPESVVREWARLHRVTCPLKAHITSIALGDGRT